MKDVKNIDISILHSRSKPRRLLLQPMSQGSVDFLFEALRHSENYVAIIHQERHKHRRLLETRPRSSHETRTERVDQNFVVGFVVFQQQRTVLTNFVHEPQKEVHRPSISRRQKKIQMLQLANDELFCDLDLFAGSMFRFGDRAHTRAEARRARGES